MQGKIEIITGPMFSSKTTALIAQADRYMRAGYLIRAFKPVLDTRYGSNIISHTSSELEAILVGNEKSPSSELMQYITTETGALFIDEIQFFDSGIVHVLEELRIKGIDVYAAGLDMDYRRIPFTFSDGLLHMGHLLALADSVDKRKAVCQFSSENIVCGKDAGYTMRVSGGTNLVEVGAENKYVATCLAHHRIP